jgi:hypothetical protein
VAGKFLVSEKSAANPGCRHQLGSGMVDLAGRHAGSNAIGQFIKNLGSNLASLAHFFDLMGTLDTDHATSFVLLWKSALLPAKQWKANSPQIERRVLASLPEDGGQIKAAQVFKTTKAR